MVVKKGYRVIIKIESDHVFNKMLSLPLELRGFLYLVR